MNRYVWILPLVACSVMTTWANTTVDRVLKSYGDVQSLSCEVRKETKAGGRNMRMLSRVHFQQTNHLHVETYAPLPRRIVANGDMLYSYIEGDSKGYRQAVEELPEGWLFSLRQVPASPMDHLLRLEGLPEEELPKTKEGWVQLGYQAPKNYVVVTLDKPLRVSQIDFYSTSARTERSASFKYSDFEQVGEAWISKRRNGTIQIQGAESFEISEFKNVQINQALPQDLFDPSIYFKDIEFSGNFDDIYGK